MQVSQKISNCLFWTGELRQGRNKLRRPIRTLLMLSAASWVAGCLQWLQGASRHLDKVEERGGVIGSRLPYTVRLFTGQSLCPTCVVPWLKCEKHCQASTRYWERTGRSLNTCSELRLIKVKGIFFHALVFAGDIVTHGTCGDLFHTLHSWVVWCQAQPIRVPQVIPSWESTAVFGSHTGTEEDLGLKCRHLWASPAFNLLTLMSLTLHSISLLSLPVRFLLPLWSLFSLCSLDRNHVLSEIN